MSLLRVQYGKNDLLFTDDGQQYIDLISSTGAVFMGHANDAINEHVVAQLDRISCSWTSEIDIQDQCKEVVGRHIADELRLYSLYSSGMEAAEVAMRIAFHETKKPGVIGFRHNHHGKSLAIQNVTGVDDDLPRFDTFRQVPFLPDHGEADILWELERALGSIDAAAVYVEPIQGRGGGHSASRDFYRELQRLCRDHGVLIICDEIFSGFYRTGPCFHYPELGIQPDIVLIGKAIGNGFPASGVLLHHRLDYHPKDFRLNSTFSDNPIACAAVVGTLSEMERIEIEKRVGQIEGAFDDLVSGPNHQIRLRGAACFVQLDSHRTAAAVHDHLYRSNVLALQREDVVGFWPPATIPDENLEYVIRVANEALAELC